MKDIFSNKEKLNELVKFLLKKWIIICCFGFGGGAVGLLLCMFNKPSFESNLTFYLDSSGLSGGMPSGLSGLASTFGLGGATGESVFEGDNFIELVKSKSIFEKALLEKIPYLKRTFAEEFIDMNELRDTWKEKSTLKDIQFPINSNRKDFTYQQDSILNQIYISLIKNNFTIKNKSSKINITEMKVKTRSHIFSRHFPEVLLKKVSDFYILTKTKKAKINYDILKFQTDSVRAELYKSIAGLASANDNIVGLNPAFNIQRVPSAKKQVDVQANTAILTELVKNLELARVNLLNNTPLIQLIDTPHYPLEKIYFRKLFGIAIGGFLGGILILAYLYFMDNRLREILTKK